MFEQRIIDQIREAWVRVATGRNNAEVAACVPDARDLKALLELTFVASTKIEEGESVKVRLVFFPDATTESLPRRTGLIDAFAFEHSVPLTVENLRKICPAIDQHTTGLAVGRAGTGYSILEWFFMDAHYHVLTTPAAPMEDHRALPFPAEVLAVFLSVIAME